MKVRLHHTDILDAFIEESYPSNFISDHEGGITERTFSASLLGGQGSYREIFMENIHIGFGDIYMKNFTIIEVASEMETVELHFALEGETKGWDADSKRTISFGFNQHNILYASNFKGNMYYPQKERAKIFEVNLLPGFFKKFLPEDEPSFKNFLDAMGSVPLSILKPHHYPITPAMQVIILEILNCKRVGLFKRLYLESKVTELLL